MRAATTIFFLLCLASGGLWSLTPPQQHQSATASPSRGTSAVFSINPSDIALSANQGQHFEVTDPDGKFVAVRWSVSGTGCSESDCGTIDNDGNYLAPEELSRPLDVVVEAVFVSDANHSLFTKIQLKPDPEDFRSASVSAAQKETTQSPVSNIGLSTPPLRNTIPGTQEDAKAAPKKDLVITYRDGKLKIDADNTTLAAVLNAIAQKTGAAINVPAGSGLEPIVEHSELAGPDDVLTQLLTGSPFNFIIVNSPGKPSQLAEVILSMRAEGTNSVNAAAIPQTRSVPPVTEAETDSAIAAVPGLPADATPSTTAQEHLSPDAIEQMMKDKAQQIRAMMQAQAGQDSAQPTSEPSVQPPNPQQQ